MKKKTRVMESFYMQWAKTRANLPYNLATSGVRHYPLKDLGIELEDLELSGPSFYGYEPLQKALAAKCNVAIDNVVAATGTSMANHLVMAAILAPGDEALIEEPAYEPLQAVAKYLGANVKLFARRFENGFRIEPEEIRKHLSKKTKLIAITNLHNPSGAWTDADTMREIGADARSCGARVLVDEVYLETLYGTAGSKSAFHLGTEFVTTSSLTKAYGLSGLRCGWILAEPGLATKIWHLNDLFGSIPSHPAERLSVVALQKLDIIAARAKALLETNRPLLAAFFAKQGQLEVVMPAFGTVAFPRLKNGNADHFCSLLAEKYQTGVVPGSFFGMPDHIRIGIGGATEMVAEGLARISAALRNT